MTKFGYARVSTEDQKTDAQVMELRAAGCDHVIVEKASGGRRDRPALQELLTTMKSGDTLIVTKIDRLARSVSHLLEVVEKLTVDNIHFKALNTPIDTTSAQGTLMLQILGAVAEFERAINHERTKAGLEAARKAGRIGGNPKLKAGNEDARKRIIAANQQSYFERINKDASTWLPIVKRLRPKYAWEDVTKAINAAGVKWSEQRLKRAVRSFVKEGLAPPALLERSPPKRGNDRSLTIVSALKNSNPNITLQEMAEYLEKSHEPTPRGKAKWSTGSVNSILKQAKKKGMIMS